MLVLGRKIGETIVIGDGVIWPRIVVRLIAADDGKGRIGVECPREVPILRGELLPEGERPGTEPNT